MTETDTPTVLVVADDPDAVALFEQYLADDHDVRVAATGEQALDLVDANTDVVLLARRLPDADGAAVLERIRSRPLDCRVALVAPVAPDSDVVEMAFDDLVVEPLEERAVRETVARLHARLRYTDRVLEYFRVANKLAALEASEPDRALRPSDEFAALEARAAELRRDVAGSLDDIDDYESAFDEIEREPGLAGSD